jgi:hypothetical protein
MSKIEFQNQPGDYILDLSCLFGLSERQVNLSTGETYHLNLPEFSKTSNASTIKSDYFLGDEYSHVSAILISNSPFVFYPKYEDLLIWPESNNDFMLVHNHNARNSLPKKILPLYREFVNDKEKKTIVNIIEEKPSQF